MDRGRGCRSLDTAPIDGYERLRQHALSHCIFPEIRVGYGVLTTRGVAAWIEVAEETAAKPIQTPSRSTGAGITAILPQLHDDLVHVMGEAILTLTAKMVL